MFRPRILRGLIVTAALVWLASGAVESQGSLRLGGPVDWSHSRIADSRRASRLGGNWRAYRKQARIEASRLQARLRTARSAIIELAPPPAPTGFRIVDSTPSNPGTPAAPDPGPGPTTPLLDWNLRTGGYGSVIGYPAKYSFDIAASSCADVMYFTVDHAGTSSRVNVIAITNSYAGCPGNTTGQTPTVKFGL